MAGRVPVLHRMTATAVPDSFPGCVAVRRRLRVRPPAGGILLLLVAGVFALALPFAGPAAAQEVVEVPRGWPLNPSGVSAGDSFRLLFVTSTSRTASSENIGEYNTYVQGRAAAGHSSIRSFSSQFRVVGSTPTVHARNNTSTTYTSSDKGVPIYWLSGDKVADDYEDFYDGSWDNKSGKGKTESGTAYNNFFRIWTGSNNNGTASGNPLGGNTIGIIQSTYTQLSLSATLNSSTAGRGNQYGLFALSPVFRVTDAVSAFDVSIESTPTNATPGYARGRDHPGPARLRRGRVGYGLALLGAGHRRGGAPRDLRVRLRARAI